MLTAYSLDAQIASIGSQLIDRVHQVAKNLENLPVYKNPHNTPLTFTTTLLRICVVYRAYSWQYTSVDV